MLSSADARFIGILSDSVQSHALLKREIPPPLSTPDREMATEMLLSRSAKEAHLRRALENAERGLVAAKRPAECYRAVVEPFTRVPHYDWFGYYGLEGNDLVLQYFLGEPTQHVRIPVGRGVCGAAVAESRNIIVDDVDEEDDYLACAPDVRSEIVVLVRGQANGPVLGELDAD